MGTRFSQAQVLRLHPLSPWQVACLFFFVSPLSPKRSQSVDPVLTHSAPPPPKEGTQNRRCGNETGGTPRRPFCLFSRHCQVLLKRGRLRTSAGSHLWRNHNTWGGTCKHTEMHPDTQKRENSGVDVGVGSCLLWNYLQLCFSHPSSHWVIT